MDQSKKVAVGTSGATSSELKPHYDTIVQPFIRRLALRAALGDAHHGRGNWVKCIDPDTRLYDIQFLRDRYNHAVEHMTRLSDGTAEDDHIGAVAWFLNFASWVESMGIRWSDVLMIRTERSEKEYFDLHGIKSTLTK